MLTVIFVPGINRSNQYSELKYYVMASPKISFPNSVLNTVDDRAKKEHSTEKSKWELIKYRLIPNIFLIFLFFSKDN